MVMVMVMAMFPPPSSRHVVTIQHFVGGLAKKSYPRVYKKFKITGDINSMPKIGLLFTMALTFVEPWCFYVLGACLAKSLH